MEKPTGRPSLRSGTSNDQFNWKEAKATSKAMQLSTLTALCNPIYPQSQEVTSCLESQEIEPFDWKEANTILERVRTALASLATAEVAGQEATVFAEEAMVPT
eukprot:scaffold86512_cov19-Tisochrysis_lutea.AAC.1